MLSIINNAEITSKAPRIAAYLSVKDEVELISETIAHLRAIGVDYIIACDISSTDGTIEILRAHEAADFKLFELHDSAIGNAVPEEESWMAQSFRHYRDAPADWILFLDADEFWLPASGNIKDCLALRNSDVVTVERLNIVLGREGPLKPAVIAPAYYDQILLYAKPIENNRAAMSDLRNERWIMGRVVPKIIARRSCIRGLTIGMHDVIVEERTTRRARAEDLIIAHLPMSSPARFEKKLANIRDIYRRESIDHGTSGKSWQEYSAAWHWRRWATITDPDEIHREFLNNAISADELEKFRETGNVASANDILRNLAPRSL